jgi:uncharacterized membrane protein
MDSPPPPPQGRFTFRRLAGLSPAYWLALAIVVYFAVSLTLSWVRALDLDTTTWDQGIYQQALWSTAHGRPFWEAADFETGGYGSLLQVHTVFLLYLLVPLYAAAPSEVTLFVVQSTVVALAAVPLYLLGRDVTGSGRWGLVAGVVYLAWAPVLAANLYDFHAEAFLPIELFSVVLLWSRARYGWGFAVGAVTFATIELAPVLLLFVGIFFLLPDRDQWRAGWTRMRSALSAGAFGGHPASELRRFLRRRRVLASLGLIVACASSYVFLVLLREQYLSSWFGISPFPPALNGYVIGASPSQLGLAWGNVYQGFALKVSYWLVLFALLGFVPFLAPRALVLAVPWVVFSFFSANLNFAIFGFQYGFIEAASLLVAFTYGLVPIQRWLACRTALATPGPSRVGAYPAKNLSVPRRWRGSAALALVVACLVVLVAVNVAASPADPLLDNSGLGSGYRISAPNSAGYEEAAQVAGLITPGATVLASDNLFPLVANDVNAYSFSWTSEQPLRLPFSSSNLPEFVLIAQSSLRAVPAWVNASVSNASDYGVRGVAWTTPAGSVVLFQRGFVGLATVFGESPPSDDGYFGAG